MNRFDYKTDILLEGSRNKSSMSLTENDNEFAAKYTLKMAKKYFKIKISS